MASEAAASPLARRYAGALIDLSESQGKLDAVADNMATLSAALADSKELKSLIDNPLLDRAAQQKAVLALADKGKAEPLTRNFLGVLAQNRRLSALPEITTAFLAERDRRRGVMTAKVTSAVALSDVQVKAIAKALKASHGADIRIETEVDPAILGGIVVRLGSKLIDFSVRSKLERLELKLKGVV